MRSATSPPDLGQRPNAVLDQAAGQITREQEAIPAQNPWRLVTEILRTSVACLALAVGFAGLAQSKRSQMQSCAQRLGSR